MLLAYLLTLKMPFRLPATLLVRIALLIFLLVLFSNLKHLLWILNQKSNLSTRLKVLLSSFPLTLLLKSLVKSFSNGTFHHLKLLTMIKNLITRDFHHNIYTMETSYKRLTPNVGVASDSLSRTQSTYEDYSFVDYASQFKSSDFDIQSLLAVGAFDMLKPTFVSTLSSMDFADKFQNFQKPAENV